jgi:hypothetical protein
MRAERSNSSRLRRRIYAAQINFRKQLRILMGREPLLKGIVYKLDRRCGKAGCRCGKGHLHAMWALSIPEHGRKRMRSVPEERLGRWRELAWAYRRFRKARAALVKIFHEILNMVNDLEQERTIPPPES